MCQGPGPESKIAPWILEAFKVHRPSSKDLGRRVDDLLLSREYVEQMLVECEAVVGKGMDDDFGVILGLGTESLRDFQLLLLVVRE